MVKKIRKLEKKQINQSNKYIIFALMCMLILIFVYPHSLSMFWPYLLMCLAIIIMGKIKDKKYQGIILFGSFSIIFLSIIIFYYLIPYSSNYIPHSMGPKLAIFSIDEKFIIEYHPDYPSPGNSVLFYAKICDPSEEVCIRCENCSFSAYFINEVGEEKIIFEDVSFENRENIDFIFPGVSTKLKLRYNDIIIENNEFFIPKPGIFSSIKLFYENHIIFFVISLISLLHLIIYTPIKFIQNDGRKILIKIKNIKIGKTKKDKIRWTNKDLGER